MISFSLISIAHVAMSRLVIDERTLNEVMLVIAEISDDGIDEESVDQKLLLLFVELLDDGAEEESTEDVLLPLIVAACNDIQLKRQADQVQS
jgi:hypothetical protein